MVDRDRDIDRSKGLALIDRYQGLPTLAKWKVALLEYGVDLRDPNVFTNYEEISKYKTKRAVKSPVVEKFQFRDSSDNNSLIPSEVIITEKGTEKTTLVKLGYRQGSPILVDREDDEIFMIDKLTGMKVPIDINLVKNRNYTSATLPESISPSQPKLEDLVQIVGQDRIGVLAFSGCWYWTSNNPCKFCDSNPKREDELSAMPSLNTFADFKFKEEDWWEQYREDYLKGVKYAFKYVLDNEEIGPHRHFQLMAGNLIRTERVWEICSQIAGTLNQVEPLSNFDSYLNISPPIKDVEKSLRMAKEQLGFRQVAFNMEVIGKARFKEVCPGKYSTIGYDNSINALKAAVPIFGRGNVRSNFVLGAQPVEELLAGVRELAEYGIASDYSVFVPKPGTPWAGRPSPDIKTIINFTNELVAIYKQQGFKGIYCGLSSRSNIFHEVLAG